MLKCAELWYLHICKPVVLLVVCFELLDNDPDAPRHSGDVLKAAGCPRDGIRSWLLS